VTPQRKACRIWQQFLESEMARLDTLTEGLDAGASKAPADRNGAIS
jgi:hypothetical protein